MSISKDEIAKAEIINQAQILFQQFGIKKTTMDEIAEACGKAKSTLYHYFKSKEEVFEAVIQKELQSLRIVVKVYVEESKSLKDKLITYVIKFHEEIISKINLFRVMKNEWYNHKDAQDYFNQLLDFEKSYLTRMLEDGYDSGEFTAIPKKDLPWFSETILSGFFGIVRFSIESKDGLDHDKLSKTVKTLIPRFIS
jgi:AcrR family transcriptional regulator